ncbi:MAG: DUF4397 domain-containing protein [Chitinophagaceae bacterium]|nr:DUF4397 domain-containing protein [Chitinophagaceae bacterium]
MNKIVLNILLFALAAICAGGCKKMRPDEWKDNRSVTKNRAVSTVRIVNLGDYYQVIANGDSLTNFELLDGQTEVIKYKGTDYFPENGRLGSIWQVPQDLFRADGTAALRFGNIGVTGSLGAPEFVVKDDYKRPMDYYLLPEQIEGQPAYVAVERGVTQPSKPDYFKIRVLNLCAKAKYPIAAERGPLENLVGPVTLTYADGTPVGPATSNITLEQRLSDYVELPYGTYQFRILTPDGRQVPGGAPANPIDKLIDPPTSTIAFNDQGNIASSRLTFAPVNTYQPGGVYTIVITPYNFSFHASASEEQSGAYQNGFRIITDVSPAVNTTYFRIQGVNALPGSGDLRFRANGQDLASGVPYGQASDYSRLVQDRYTIEAADASGKTLASVQQLLRPGQNYTAWLYPDQQGAAKLVLVANDLSGQFESTTNGPVYPDDNSLGYVKYDFMFDKRFLNLSPDNPYISFTLDNGQLAVNKGATVNLQPGIAVTEQPYSSGAVFGYRPFQIMAYRSSPTVVPGAWADDIPVLKSSAFVALPGLYEAAGRDVPAQEPGVYTVALIGRTGNGISQPDKAKLILVKHNR